MSSTGHTQWQPPAPQATPPVANQQPAGQPNQPPRYGAYGTPPVGQPPNWEMPPVSAGAPPAFGPGAFVRPYPGIIPLKPLTFSDIFNGAFRSLRASPRAMFIPTLLVTLVSSVLTVPVLLGFYFEVNAASSTTGQGIVLTLLRRLGLPNSYFGLYEVIFVVMTYLMAMVLVQIASVAVITGLVSVTVSRTILGRVAAPAQVWQRTKGRLGVLIGQSLLVTFVVEGTLFLPVPLTFAALIALPYGSTAQEVAFYVFILSWYFCPMLALILHVKLCLAPVALILERVGPIEGIRRSWTLTRGSFWRVTGIRILTFIIIYIACAMVGSALGLIGSVTIFLFSFAEFFVHLAVYGVIGSLLSTLILPLDAAVTTLLYTDLRMRTEGLDIELRRAAEA